MKGKYSIKSSLTGSSNKEEYFDENNHVVKSAETYVTGKRLNKMYSYDKCGRLTSDYQLTSSSTPTDQAQNSYFYDEYGRIERIVSLTGTTNYTYEKLKTTITNPLGTFVKEYNAAGQLIKSTENGKSVTFSYYPSGLTKTSTDAENNLTVSFEYDVAGNRTKITDPDVGTITSEYDSYGREIVHTTEKGAVITHEYDSKGRLIEESDGSTKSIFTYNSNNQLTKESTSNYSCEYRYNSFGRITQKNEVIAGTTFTTKYTYNNYYDGPATMSPPSGLPLSYEYDEYGNMKLAKCQDKNIWIPSQIDTKGRLTEETLYNVTRKYEYSKSGMLTRETAYYGTTGLMDLSYSYSSMKLSQKTDALSSNTEKYTYDNLNRLSNVQIINSEYNKSLSGNVTYDARNNMTKTFDSHWTSISYGNGKAPHQVSSISYSQYVPNGNRTVSFDSYRMVKQIVDGPYTYKITYRPNHERCMTQMYKSGSLQRTTYYCDNYERVIDANGKEKKIHYLCGDNGLVGIYVIDNGKDSFFTAVTDRQNSLTAVMANAGKKVERFSYKPWGMRRDPKRWDLNNATDYAVRFSRGYCMHEHVRELGLIDMGGRMYDEHTHQFLSPDPYMQDPESWLSHNRFSYCMHNPVMYTDPNGEFIWAIPAAVFLVAGAANVAANWDNINGWEQGLTSFLVGGGTAAGITVSAMTGVGFGSMLAIAFGSGATTAATNNVISQTGKGFSGFSDVRWESVGLNSVIGGFSSMIGYAAGYGMANISNLTINGTNISSPILKGFVGGVLGGGTSGYISGFSADMMTTGNYKSAVKAGLSGMWKSAVMGAGLGILGGCSYAHKTGVNPWTGKVNASQTPAYNMIPETGPYAENVTLYRGMSGHENSKGPLFMTTDKVYAEIYAQEHNCVVESVTIPRSTFNVMQYNNLIRTLNGEYYGNYSSSYTEYLIDQSVKSLFLNNLK